MMKEFQILPIGQIVESATNPRRHYAEQAMQELTESIKRHGVLVPLLVRPVNGSFEIIAGSRRFKAALAAKLEVLPVRIKEIGDNEALEIQILENLVREDVHPLEEAQGYKMLLGRPGYDVSAIVAKIAKSESYVYQRLKLCDLIPAAQKSFLEDKITARHALLICRLQSKDQKLALAECFDEYPNINGKPALKGAVHLADWIQHNIHLDLHSVPFKKDLAFPFAGPCTECPKRTGFLPQLFPDIAKKDTCTDPICYKRKLAAFIENEKQDFAAIGRNLIELSTSYHIEKGSEALSSNDWREVTKKDRCEHTQKGIVTTGHHDLGKVIDVCADRNCKQHRGASRYQRSPTEITQQKKRKLENEKKHSLRSRLVHEILTRVGHELSPEDLQLVAGSLAREMQSDDAKLVCKSHGWAMTNAHAARKTIESQLPGLGGYELIKLLIELSLSCGASFQFANKLDLLNSTAERYGIKVKSVEKAVNAEFDQKEAKKKARQTKSQKADKKKKASKSAPAADPCCEICACTELYACPGGCSWDPKYLKNKRYMCTSCTDKK